MDHFDNILVLARLAMDSQPDRARPQIERLRAGLEKDSPDQAAKLDRLLSRDERNGGPIQMTEARSHHPRVQEDRYRAAQSAMLPLLQEGHVKNLDSLVQELSGSDAFSGDEVRACFWGWVDAGKVRCDDQSVYLV
jgi:hypothetical protein